MESLSAIILAFVTIFMIMDPFASLPPFLTFTKGCKDEEIKKTANNAVIIAGVLAVIFIFGGMEILGILSITLFEFKIAGGIVLALLGLENVLNFSFSKNQKDGEGLDSVAVLIATPLLTGPGLISSLILLVQEYGITSVLIALGFALVICWVILRNAIYVKRILGQRVLTILSKIIGLLLIAMGVGYIKSGILG
ncbi:MAG: MarC family protein [Candidatus ainarchaeum sp.]|nr:MarC family protein [Candidatus ainarchaeum sp.]